MNAWNMPFVPTIGLLLTALVGSNLEAADSANAWKHRFEKEAIQRWKEYEAQAVDLRGTFWHKRTLLSNNSVIRESQYELKGGKTGGWIRIDRIRGFPSTRGDLDGYNPNYTFNLQRRQPSAPWVIASTDLRRQNAAELEARVRFRASYGLAIFGPQSYLPTMAEEPGFQVSRVEPISKEGKTLIKVHFVRSAADLKVAPVVRGELLLDPERYWLLVEFDVIQEFLGDGLKVVPNRMKGSITYSQTTDGLPVVERHVLIADLYLPGQGPVEERYEFSLNRASCTEKDFTLSAFGLPEPPGIEWKKPTPWWLWAAGAGLVCIIIAGAFRWLKARAARA